MDHEDIPRNAKDIIQKVLADVLKDTLVEWFGLDIPSIVSVLPSHLPTVEIHDRTVDSIFVTADEQLLHLEFQSTSIPSLDRFAHYALTLATTHRKKVRTIVIYTAPIDTAPEEIDYGSVKLTVHNILIAKKDGQSTWARLQNTPAEIWTTHDDLDLAFLPFMCDPTTTAKQRAIHAVEHLLNLPVGHRRFAGALIAGMTSTFLDPTVVKLIKEAIKMNELIRQLEEEAIERGLSKGFQQGIQEGVQQGVEQGVRQGLQEGLHQGLQRGLQKAAIQLMRTRFGPLDFDVIARIESLDSTQLQTVVLAKILEVESLSALMASLPQS